MVRIYLRKTGTGCFTNDIMERAVKKVLDENYSLKSVQNIFVYLSNH